MALIIVQCEESFRAISASKRIYEMHAPFKTVSAAFFHDNVDNNLPACEQHKQVLSHAIVDRFARLRLRVHLRQEGTSTVCSDCRNRSCTNFTATLYGAPHDVIGSSPFTYSPPSAVALPVSCCRERHSVTSRFGCCDWPAHRRERGPQRGGRPRPLWQITSLTCLE